MESGGEQVKAIRSWQLGKAEWLAIQAPMLLPAIALVCGILIGQLSQQGAWYWPAGTWILGLLSAFILRHKAIHALLLVCACGFACLGMVRTHHARLIGADDIRRYLPDDPRPDDPRLVVIHGIVWSRPRRQAPDWSFKGLSPWQPPISLLIAARQIQTADGLRACRGLVRVRVQTQSEGQEGPESDPCGIEELRPGDLVRLAGWLARSRPATNPGQFDMAWYLERRQVRPVMTVRSSQAIERLYTPWFGWPLRLVGWLQDRAAMALRCGWAEETAGWAMVSALLLGSRSEIDGNTYQAFRQTGLVHYLSLSGLHFGIIIGTVWLIGHLLGLLRPTRAWLCILAAGLYLLVIPSTAPTWRAAVIAGIHLGAIILRRQGYPFNTLALAAIVLLLVRPLNLFAPSWQLSFACLVGIFLISVPLQQRIQGLIQPYSTGGLGMIILGRAFTSIAGLLTVGIGAFLGSAGIILYHFYRLNLLSVIWTCLVFPFVWLIMVFGVIKLFLCLFLPQLGHILAGALEILAGALCWLVGHLSRLDLMTIRTGSIGPDTTILYYCALLLAVLRPLARPIFRIPLGTLFGLLFLAIVFYGSYKRAHADDLVITCLDVGHGQAVIVQGPGGTRLLIDGGSLFIPDVGGRLIVPALEYLGIGRLDAIFISHTDIDHVNGIPEVLEAIRTRLLYADLDDGPASGIIKKACSDVSVPISSLSGVQSTCPGGLQIKVLWPPSDLGGPELSDNDRSAVILLTFAGRSVLLCSDIEQYAQGQLISRNPDLDVDVILLPHHGSVKTMLPDFVARLRPDVILCSCTADQALQVQSSRYLLGGELYCTGNYGAITVRIGPSGKIDLKTFLPTGRLSSS